MVYKLKPLSYQQEGFKEISENLQKHINAARAASELIHAKITEENLNLDSLRSILTADIEHMRSNISNAYNYGVMLEHLKQSLSLLQQKV